MKQLFFSAVACLLFSFAAQAQSITVNNNTSCDVHLRLFATTPIGSCGSVYRSQVFTVNGTSSLNFTDPTAVTGGMYDIGGFIIGTGGWFDRVQFLECNPAYCGPCAPVAANVRDASCGGPTTNTHSFFNAACVTSSCGTVNINYSNTGGNITVTVF